MVSAFVPLGGLYQYSSVTRVLRPVMLQAKRPLAQPGLGATLW